MGTAGRLQTQFMALVDEGQLDRMDALRVATGDSRAEINRKALDGAPLEVQEQAHGAQLRRLEKVASRLGMHTDVFVRALVQGRRAGVPKLEQLEAMSHAALLAEVTPR